MCSAFGVALARYYLRSARAHVVNGSRCQDSLGGNTRTTVIATLGPMLEHKDESVSTLMFADRASRVVTRVRRNEVVDDAVLLARAQREISRLRELLTNNELAQQYARRVGLSALVVLQPHTRARGGAPSTGSMSLRKLCSCSQPRTRS